MPLTSGPVARIIGFEIDPENETRCVQDILEFDRTLNRNDWKAAYSALRYGCGPNREIIIQRDISEPLISLRTRAQEARDAYDVVRHYRERLNASLDFFEYIVRGEGDD